MYMDKGIITEEEQILISRYPDEIQEKLKDILLKDKEISFSSNSYDSWIKTMEEGQEIIFIKDVVRLVGGFNDALLLGHFYRQFRVDHLNLLKRSLIMMVG